MCTWWHLHSVRAAAVFAAARVWRWPACWMQGRAVCGHACVRTRMHIGASHSRRERGHLAVGDHTHGPRGHSAKRGNSDRERQMPRDPTSLWGWNRTAARPHTGPPGSQAQQWGPGARSVMNPGAPGKWPVMRQAGSRAGRSRGRVEEAETGNLRASSQGRGCGRGPAHVPHSLGGPLPHACTSGALFVLLKLV